MQTRIYSNKVLIGKADLSISDESMGVLTGEFIPNEDYSTIREIVWKYYSKNNKDFDLWNSLGLNVQLENGYFLHAIGGVSIWDIKELKNEKIEIEIAGVFKHVIDDYFKTIPARCFLEEPWESLTINQKITFENELKKEIGEKKGIINRLFDSKNNHIMTNYSFSALCTSGLNDDVLYSIYSKKNIDFDFALVHLTWRQKREQSNYPKTEFYKDFDDFKQRRMIPDKEDWNE